MTAAELAAWLRDHPDAVVFRCGCVWTLPMMATISHRPAQFRPGQFLPFKP